MTRICLTMIVKDEAPVIERCLLSARDWVDYWVIIDTGSSDATMDIIRKTMDGVPGNLLEKPWVNFAHNRNEVMDVARVYAQHCDYALWIDADEVFTDEPTSRRDLDLTLDGYFLNVAYDGLAYQRLALTRLDQPWSWVGPIHETLVLDGAVSGNLDRPGVMVRHDGARSRDPQTYVKDAALLEEALEEDPENTRLRFYYAQSLKDAGELGAAYIAYVERIELDGWLQEVFISYLERGRLAERMSIDSRGDYLSAYEADPRRAEPLVELARIERQAGRFHVALIYSSLAIKTPAPVADALFVDTAAYAWRRWDEHALCCWYTGNQTEARFAAQIAYDANPTDPRLAANVRLMA